ncbi:MAG: B12-binding domain-containing radical SAM protein [Thermodesulfobacteriota bacterium]
MKILLLEPLCPPSAMWGSVKEQRGFLPPMGLLSIYTYLKHKTKHQVEFCDTQFGDISEEDLTRKLQAERYELIGIPVYTSTADNCFFTAKLCRQALPNAKIVFGNIHATSMPERTLAECPECDFIIRHEGELTLVELMEALRQQGDFSGILGLVWRQGQKIIINPPRTLIKNLDMLPVGLYDDLDLSRYVPHITNYVVLPNYPFVTQRGCPYRCTYCGAANIMGKAIRRYSTDRVIEELKILKYDKGAKGLYFQDSTFTVNRHYTMELMEKMIKEKLDLLWSCNTRTDRIDPELLAKMKAAGCRRVVIGIESANQASLEVIKKGVTVEQQTRAVQWVHEARLKLMTSFILCLPGETEEMVANTIQYAKKLKGQIALFYLPVPYPGTKLYEYCKQTGLVREDAAWSEYLSLDFDNPIYINPLIGKERMKYWYKRAFWEYYTSPGIWWKNLTAISGRHDFEIAYKGLHAWINLSAKKMLHGLSKK